MRIRKTWIHLNGALSNWLNILLNLRGIAEPTHIEREIVDLLFFPTGGGKTEAYLGLAAFTLVFRRLRNPDPAYRGLSVLMRYTATDC